MEVVALDCRMVRHSGIGTYLRSLLESAAARWMTAWSFSGTRGFSTGPRHHRERLGVQGGRPPLTGEQSA